MIHQHQRCVCRVEGGRERSPQIARCARNNDHLIGEVEHLLSPYMRAM